MIDRRKNAWYVIRVWYMKDREKHEQKFLSLHGMNSPTFEAFRDRYFRKVLQVDPSQIGRYDGDIGSQHTISNKDWPRLKDEAQQDITAAETCT